MYLMPGEKWDRKPSKQKWFGIYPFNYSIIFDMWTLICCAFVARYLICSCILGAFRQLHAELSGGNAITELWAQGWCSTKDRLEWNYFCLCLNNMLFFFFFFFYPVVQHYNCSSFFLLVEYAMTSKRVYAYEKLLLKLPVLMNHRCKNLLTAASQYKELCKVV